jgi:hypothetical protein
LSLEPLLQSSNTTVHITTVIRTHLSQLVTRRLQPNYSWNHIPAQTPARTVGDAAQHLLDMSGPPAQALATHLINQTLSSLSVLETLNIISRDDASQIRSKLPNPYGPFPSLGAASSPSATTSFGQLSLGPASPPPHQSSQQPPMPPMHNQMTVVPSIPPRAPQREVRARALWDYAGAVSRAGVMES